MHFKIVVGSTSLKSFPTTNLIFLLLCPFKQQLHIQPSHIHNMEGQSTSTSSIGSAVAFILVSWILIHRWNQRAKKGPKTWPVLGAAIEHLMNYDRMHDWLVKYHSYMEVLLGDGIFNSDGEMWRRQRKTASFEFASKNLRDFSAVVFREYAVKLASILCQASEKNQELDMQELFMRMTLDSICKVGFGVEIGTLSPRLPDNRFAKAFDMANIIVTLRFIDPFWRIKRFLHIGSEALLKQSINLIDEFTYGVIRKRKGEIERTHGSGKMKHDLLSRFIELSKDPESNLTDKSLRDIVLNFVIAGRDTTAATTSWFTYMVMTHPRVADKLFSELKSFEEERAREEQVTLVPYNPDDTESFNERITQFAELLNYDYLGRLSYLHAAISETLRLYPAVPQDPKGILKDDVLPDGTQVKAGGMVTYVPYSMGRMAYLWGPDASAFKPERWFHDGNFQNVSPFKFNFMYCAGWAKNMLGEGLGLPSDEDDTRCPLSLL